MSLTLLLLVLSCIGSTDGKIKVGKVNSLKKKTIQKTSNVKGGLAKPKPNVAVVVAAAVVAVTVPAVGTSCYCCCCYCSAVDGFQNLKRIKKNNHKK